MRGFVPPGSACGDGGVVGRGASMSNVAASFFGFGGFGGGGRHRASSSAGTPVADDDDNDVEDEDEIGPDGQRTNSPAKACWTEENTFKLCVIACEEMRDGNCPNGTWTTRCYQNLKEKYLQRAHLKHSTKQIKNRMVQLKSIYLAWVWLNQQTGGGRGPNGEITGTDGWWKGKIKTPRNSAMATLST